MNGLGAIYARHVALKLLAECISPTIPLPKTGPISWKHAVNAMGHDARMVFLRAVLRTRRRTIPVGFNGKTWLVKRAELRDWLRNSFVPLIARQRPIPASAGETIRFRRWNPYGGTK